MSKISSRKQSKRAIAFVLALLMLFNQNLLLKTSAEESVGTVPTLTYLYQETFEGTSLPTGFSGKGTIDTESKVLKIKELGDTDISITPVEGVNKYTIEFDMMRVDEYDASTNNFIQLKMYDSSNTEICMYNTSFANLRIAYMDGTRKYRELQNDSEIYVVEKGNWATYKYEVDVAEKTIVLTVTDKDGNVYVDNNATQSPFYGNGNDLAKFQFKVPRTNGAGAASEAEYSVDNFKVYYETPQDLDGEGDEDSGSNGTVEIPEGTTAIYQESFEGTALPTGFSGKGIVDTENKVLKIKELGDTDISITPVEGVNKYTIEFDMVRVDEYDASTNNYIQLKMYDASNAEICMYNTSNANLRIAYMDGTRKYRELQNDSEIYVVEKGNWATYKYEVDVAEKTIVLTVTDKDGNVYVDNNATQSPFYGNGNDLAKFQFKVPRTNGAGAASEVEYSVDNFKVYYAKPVACIGNTKYTTISEAISDAECAEEAVVIILEDNFTSAEAITIKNSNVTLDLNGYTLTTSYLTSYGDVVDNSIGKTGRLKVFATNGMLAAGNSQVPIYITDEGYMFATMTRQSSVTKTDDSFTVISRPSFGDNYTRLAGGAEDVKLKFIIRLDWGKDVNGDFTDYQEFVYNDDLVQTVYGSGKAFLVTVNGLKNYTENMKVTVLVRSTDLEVEWVNNSFYMSSTN